MSQPGFFFYTGDWLKDTRGLSLEARGAWIDLLCALHEAGGSVTWPLQAYDHYWSTVERNGVCYSAREILDELIDLNICTIVTDPNGKITVTSRRMSRELNSKENNRKRQERFREKQGNNASVTDKSNASSYSSSSSESSSLKIKNPDPATPEPSADFKQQEKKPELPEAVKVACSAIYAIDPKRYERLVVWTTAALKHYSPDVVVASLERFYPYANAPNISWWGYLDRILDKAEVKNNARNSEAESENHKREEREFIEKMHRRN